MSLSLIRALSDHIERHIGPIASVLHETIPDEPHIDIHVVAPSANRPHYTLITSGMSQQPMKIPEEMSELTPFAELMLALPKDWCFDDLNDPKWEWPIRWMRFLAKYPHQTDTWLYVGHTVPNGPDGDPFAPGTSLCCWFLREPRTTDEGFAHLDHEGHMITFLAMTAIHRSEMDFALSNGVDTLFALDQALAAAGVSELLDAARPPMPLRALRLHTGRLG